MLSKLLSVFHNDVIKLLKDVNENSVSFIVGDKDLNHLGISGECKRELLRDGLFIARNFNNPVADRSPVI